MGEERVWQSEVEVMSAEPLITFDLDKMKSLAQSWQADIQKEEDENIFKAIMAAVDTTGNAFIAVDKVPEYLYEGYDVLEEF